MATQYVSQKTTILYESATGRKSEMVLIFGDEVETNGSAVNNRVKSEFRGRSGFIDIDHLMDDPVLEIYIIDVKQGDSIFIVTPGRKKILIDGGVNHMAKGFLAWKYQLDIKSNDVDIDYVVLSHADVDHIRGLIPIVAHPKIQVHNVIDSGIATYQKGIFQNELGNLDTSGKYLVTRNKNLQNFNMPELSDDFAAWVNALKADKVAYSAVSSSSGSLNVGDNNISIDVLGPRLENLNNKQVYRWFENVSETINGHSVVLRLSYGNVSALFPGDINDKGSDYLLEDQAIASKLGSHIFKAPHHGSHKYSPKFLKAVRPQISVISSGDEPDHGHPRANFIGAVGKLSRVDDPLVFSTEIAATFIEVNVPQPKIKTVPAGGSESEIDDNIQKERTLFKKRLNGMINIRTDGQKIIAARRVAAGYWWESYEKVSVP